NVTIDQVAAAADVSPSSVYRYFGTKAGLILVEPGGSADPTDRLTYATDRACPIDAARQIIAESLSTRPDDTTSRRRVRYVMESPAVQAELSRHLLGRLRAVAERFARDRDPRTHLESEVTWGAIYGALLGALQYWHSTDFSEPLARVVDDALTILHEGGLGCRT
ncbi:MAG TPA: TetR family transcriptional regulator, partial [Actinopolymorphaceae bacterium]